MKQLTPLLLISMALFAVLASSCSKINNDAKCFIHYTSGTLDSKTTAARQTIVDNPRPRVQSEIDALINTFAVKSYEEYGGAVCNFSKDYSSDVLVDNTGWKTIKLTRKTGSPDYNLIYIHGGAFFLNFRSDLHAPFCEKLASSLNASIYMPLYPLAPVHKVNEGLTMILDVYKKLLKEGKPIYVMGESVGGTLALTFTLYLKELGLKLPDAVFPISPLSDFTMDNSEIQKFEDKDIMTSICLAKSCRHWAENGMSYSDPKVSPIHGNLKGMPKTFIYNSSDDIVSPDTMLLYDKMKAAGVEVGMLYGKNLWHYAVLFDIPAREQYLKEVISFIGK